MIGPTFVAQFSDGTITRMTTHCGKGLDLARGIKLSRDAYEIRHKKSAPAILSGRFEEAVSGALLEEYDTAAIEALK